MVPWLKQRIGAGCVFVIVPGLGKAKTQQMEFKENKKSLTLRTKEEMKVAWLRAKEAVDAWCEFKFALFGSVGFTIKTH